MKIKFLVIIILTAFFNNTFAQDQKNSKFKYGYYFSPEYQYRQLSLFDVPNTNKNILNNIYNDRDTTERFKIGFSVGLTTTYSPAKFLAIRTGLIFSNKGFGFKKMPTCRPNPQDCKVGFAGKLPGAKMMEGTSNYNYLSLPLLLHLKINIQEHAIGLFGGTTINYHLFNLEHYIEYGPNGEKFSHYYHPAYQDYFYNFMNEMILGVSYEHKIFKKYVIAVEPTFKYSSPIYKPTGLQTNLYSFGIGFDLKHDFKIKNK